MEFNLLKKSVGVPSAILDTVSEQPVDMDFILPDYCPDVEKILRCKMTPKIYNRSISGGQLQIDGTTVVTVLYVDGQKGCIRACEQTIPFNSVFQIKDIPENCIIEANAKPEYLNCRALSQRRLSIHGAFSLYAKVIYKGTVDLFAPEEDTNLQCRTKDISCVSLSSMCQDSFSAGDEISITNKPPVEVVLDSEVKANITDYRIIPQKLMINGELSVKLLYLSDIETGQPQQIDYIIPFSHIADCENLDENTLITPYISVLSHEIRLKSDMLSEAPVVDVDAKLSVTAMGYNIETVPIITDAYSTEHSVDLLQNRANITSQIAALKDTFIQKDEISLDGTDVSSICDISTEYNVLSPVITAEGIMLNSKMNICIIAFDSDKNPVYLERSVELSKNIQTDDNFTNIEKLSSSIASLSYRMGENNTLELRTEIRYCITLTSSQTYNNVSSVTADDSKKIPKRSCALTLYYADKGESLWDIAKEYSTKMNSLLEENSLDTETLESPQMLLIPMV